MKSSRRSFLSRLAVALAAPIIPAVVPAAQVEKPVAEVGEIFFPTMVVSESPTVGRGMTRPVFLYDEDVRFYYPMHEQVHPDVAAKLNASFAKTLS